MVALAIGCNDGKTTSSSNPAQVAHGNYPEAYSKPPEPFRTAEDGIDHHAIVYLVKLSLDDSLSLNGESLAASALRENARKAIGFNPPPYFVTEIQSGTPCKFVVEHRSGLAESPLCRSGHCAEGQDWRQWPIKIGPDKFVDPD